MRIPHRVRLFTKTICPSCERAKEFFRAHQIPFEEVNIDIDRKAGQEMINKTSQVSVPVVQVGESWIVGFDEEKIKRALGITH